MENEHFLLTIEALTNELGIAFSHFPNTSSTESHILKSLAANKLYFSRVDTYIYAACLWRLNEETSPEQLLFGPFLLPETDIDYDYLNQLVQKFKNTICHLFLLIHRRKPSETIENNLFFEMKQQKKNMPYNVSEDIEEIYRLELLLFCHIKDNNKKGAKMILQMLYKNYFAFFSVIKLKQQFISLVTLLTRVEVEQGNPVQAVFAKQENFLSMSESINNNTSAFYYMDKAIDNFFNSFNNFPKHNYSSTVIRMINYLENHLNEFFTLKDVSNVLAKNDRYLGRLFLKEVHCSYKDFILNRRIQEAKKMLLFTDQRIEAIAMQLAFSSQSHFTKKFHSVTGQTPRKYRNSKAFYLY